MKIAIVDLTPKNYPIKVFSDVAKTYFFFKEKKQKNHILKQNYKKKLFKYCFGNNFS